MKVCRPWTASSLCWSIIAFLLAYRANRLSCSRGSLMFRPCLRCELAVSNNCVCFRALYRYLRQILRNVLSWLLTWPQRQKPQLRPIGLQEKWISWFYQTIFSSKNDCTRSIFSKDSNTSHEHIVLRKNSKSYWTNFRIKVVYLISWSMLSGRIIDSKNKYTKDVASVLWKRNHCADCLLLVVGSEPSGNATEQSFNLLWCSVNLSN